MSSVLSYTVLQTTRPYHTKTTINMYTENTMIMVACQVKQDEIDQHYNEQYPPMSVNGKVSISQKLRQISGILYRQAPRLEKYTVEIYIITNQDIHHDLNAEDIQELRAKPMAFQQLYSKKSLEVGDNVPLWALETFR